MAGGRLLFDYLMTNMETQLSRSNLGKTYLEANDVLHSKSLPLGKERLVKAVTVLSSMGKSVISKPLRIFWGLR